MSFLRNIFIAFGFLTFLRLIWYIYKVLRAYLSKPINLKSRNVKWAMITGASSGIGYELTLQIASQGVNIVALGRNEERLTELEKKCLESNKIEFLKIPIDFIDVTAVQTIFERIGNRHIDAMFVCHGSGKIAKYDELSDEEVINNNNMMIHSNVLLSKYFITQKGGKGQSISFVSSANSFLTTPFLTSYVSCKRFLSQYSDLLKSELHIPVQCYNAGHVKDTRFFDSMPKEFESAMISPVSMTPQRVAEIMLATYGTSLSYDIGADTIVMRLVFWLVPLPVMDAVLKSMAKKLFDMFKKSD
ncbi:SDR family oxidoreductase [Histomonas meleagridis]|uniref:SDR family oxidoreductase n=1 Tax=Histomonas meleagridis TaxID=135588 RepID=UPI003559679B|nr:SDR family oxidoreductase [Histomonas meleagridis]KAH0796367.1 SDR family oxidoreductase [Histomonas meleagridis]